MSDISREDEIIGANVKKFRESQGISRKDLAHIFHISEDGVYRIERGRREGCGGRGLPLRSGT